MRSLTAVGDSGSSPDPQPYSFFKNIFFLFLMPDIWGLLPKSQVDSQTIDEAISSAIDSHEADADAHLGADESLQSHKAEAIIDHVAGSVLADKLSMTEYQAKTIFEAWDKWDTTGAFFNNIWPGVSLWSDYSPSNPAQLDSKDSAIPDYIDYTKNILFQCTAKVTETVNKVGYFGYGFMDSGDVVSGFGFKIINNSLYGYSDASGSLETVALTGVDISNTHVYRAQWDQDINICYFFVDGDLKGAIETASPSGTGDGDILFRIEVTAVGESYLYIYELYTARDI